MFFLHFPIIIAGCVDIIKDLCDDCTCRVANKDSRGADEDAATCKKEKKEKEKCGIQLLCVNAAPASWL